MAKDHDVLDDMQEQLIAKLSELGLTSCTSQIIAHKLKSHFRKHWGGQNIYFTKSKDLSKRDQAIYEEYDGRNKVELLRKYDMSEQTFYKIIKKVRSEYVAKQQISLDF